MFRVWATTCRTQADSEMMQDRIVKGDVGSPKMGFQKPGNVTTFGVFILACPKSRCFMTRIAKRCGF